MGHIMRTVVQAAWDVMQGALQFVHPHGFPTTASDPPKPSPKENPTDIYVSCDDGWILAQFWKDRFMGLFKEMKVHRITAHFMPYESITSPGDYIFSLSDYGENSKPTNVNDKFGMSASVIRKNGQPSKLVWFPTEPDDRNWHVIGDGHKYCDFSVQELEPSYNVDIPGGANKKQKVGVQGKI